MTFLIHAFLLGGPAAAHAEARVGQLIPHFSLERLTGGRVERRQLLGRPLVLVVGRTREAAPPCKEWVLDIIKRHGRQLPVYQVIVVDKPWFAPRSYVLGQVRGFSPAAFHHRVLLEWYTVFARDYGIKKHDDPVVLAVAPDGVLRWRRRGRISEGARQELARVLKEMGRTPAGGAPGAP